MDTMYMTYMHTYHALLKILLKWCHRNITCANGRCVIWDLIIQTDIFIQKSKSE